MLASLLLAFAAMDLAQAFGCRGSVSAAATEDEKAITIEDDNPDEDRFITIGMDAFGNVLAVVYTWRGNDIRIISARKATKRERQQYES